MDKRSCKNCMYVKKKEGTLYFCTVRGMVAPECLLPKGCKRWRRKNG